MSVDQFIAQLRGRAAIESVANPYNCYELGVDATQEAFFQRCLQLAAYLRHRLETARIIMVAEAPGYQGARFSGLAMTRKHSCQGEWTSSQGKTFLVGAVCMNELAMSTYHLHKQSDE